MPSGRDSARVEGQRPRARRRKAGMPGIYRQYSLRSKYCCFIEYLLKCRYSLYSKEFNMMPASLTTKRQLIEQFLDTLRALPDVHAELDHRVPVGLASDSRHDAQIDLQVAGKSFILLIEAKKNVYPRDVHQVLWQFREISHNRLKEQNGDEALSLLIAESISPGAKELLIDERVGYYDSGGSLYLPAPGAYLYIDKPPPKTLAKSVRFLFSGRRAQVLHTLLVHHQNWFGGKELAEQALVSPATASQVLTELERFDWLASRGKGPGKERHLREPAALLDAWVKQLASSSPPPCCAATTSPP